MLWTTIDLAAIAHNVRTLKAEVGPGVNLLCVVKADAYGHGIDRVVPVMVAAGADAFGVATLAEAQRVLPLAGGKPVVAWMWDPQEPALPPGIDLVIPSPQHARRVLQSPDPRRVYIEVETGMHRAGVEESAWAEIFGLLRDAPQVEVLGLMSHLACADDPADPYTDQQVAAFARALRCARAAGLECPVNHLANTPALLTRADVRYQQVRVGLGLYGLEPVPGQQLAQAAGLKPAMRWQARVTALKPLAAGEGTCYGLTWRAPHATRLANVAVGYGDGLPRSCQGALQVGINGKLYPQVGRVCMDQIMIAVGDDEVQVGDIVTLMGAGGWTATEWAAAMGTINYEVVCLPTGRTRRTYVEGGAER